jgi:hypothetical protein
MAVGGVVVGATGVAVGEWWRTARSSLYSQRRRLRKELP